MSATSLSTDTAIRWDAAYELPSPRTDREITRAHRVEAFLARRLLNWCAKQPVEKAARRLGAFTQAIGPMIRPVHNRGKANLQLIYPDMTPAEQSAILRDVWRNIGMVAGEMPHLDKLAERTTIVGEEKLAPFLTAEDGTPGKNAIFFSTHSANWEAISATLLAKGLRYGIVYRAANNPLVDQMIIDYRARGISRRQVPKSKRGSRDMIRMLSDGLSLCMLTDQKLNDGIEAPLLGYPAMTASSAARLALKNDLPMIPIRMERRPGSTFVLTVEDPVEIEKTGDTLKEAAALTVAMNDALGRMILERPDQWLWFHRRWPKTVVA